MKRFASVFFLSVLLLSCGADGLAPAGGGSLSYRIADRRSQPYPHPPRWLYKVIVETGRIPSEEQLKALARKIWEAEKRKGHVLLLYLYLPGMDLAKFAYAEASFEDRGMRRFLINEASLAGTKWGGVTTK